MGLVLDAGALVAIDRGDRRTHLMLQKAGRTKAATSCAVLAQVWRDGTRQSRLAMALKGIDTFSLNGDVDRRIGELLRRAGTSDAVDGHVALLTRPGDYVVTSDPDDIGHLLDVREIRANVLRV